METCCNSRPSFPRKSESPSKANSLFINPSGTTGKRTAAPPVPRKGIIYTESLSTVRSASTLKKSAPGLSPPALRISIPRSEPCSMEYTAGRFTAPHTATRIGTRSRLSASKGSTTQYTSPASTSRPSTTQKAIFLRRNTLGETPLLAGIPFIR